MSMLYFSSYSLKKKSFLWNMSIVNTKMQTWRLQVLYPLHHLGAELYRGHGGKNTAVSKRTQTLSGVRSRGAELLEATFE